jgi:hypothetical protein
MKRSMTLSATLTSFMIVFVSRRRDAMRISVLCEVGVQVEHKCPGGYHKEGGL